jgi:glycosyltransferase involved in cell wall biosynthesis
MRLLFLSHDIPSPAESHAMSLYYLIGHLSALYGHDVTLISFASERCRAEDFEYLKNVCSIENPVTIQWDALKKLLLKAVKNSILNLPRNLRHGLWVNELDYYYDYRMDQTIKEALKKNNFELIFSTRQMANYVVDVEIPKIVQPYDAMSEYHRQVFADSRGLKRIAPGIRYALNRSYEKRIYEKFDRCLVVTQREKEALESLNPRIRGTVLPNGVDVDYFSPIDINEEPASLTLLAHLYYPAAIANVVHFYNEVFPLILRENPDVKLYLVGRDPAKEITDLSADPSVRVTGYVNDVRPYLAKSTVFIAPETIGTGMKNKVQQAMSMGKAVVTTTIGARGIAVRNHEHLVIADTPSEFANETASLLTDQQMRAALGANARKLMEEQYSWDAITKVLNELLFDMSCERQEGSVRS